MQDLDRIRDTPLSEITASRRTTKKPSLSLLFRKPDNLIAGSRPSTAIPAPWLSSSSERTLSLSQHATRLTPLPDGIVQDGRSDSRAAFRQMMSAGICPTLDTALEHCLLNDVVQSSGHNAFAARPKGLSCDSTLRASRLWTAPSFKLDPPTAQRMPRAMPQISPKLMVLSDNGCILQYGLHENAAGVPEALLQLGPSSTATASDAIPGKHWVLQITHDARVESIFRPAMRRMLQSKLFSGKANSCHRLNVMFLLFDNAHTFDVWLTTIRKEIEVLGGLLYRPDSHCDDLDTTKRLSRRNRTYDSTMSLPLTFDTILPSPESAHKQGRESLESSESTIRGSIIGLSRGSNDSRPPSGRASDRSEAITGETSEHTESQSKARTNLIVADEKSTQHFGIPPPRMQRKGVPKAIELKLANRRRSASCSPALPSSQFSRTPTLAPDAPHSGIQLSTNDMSLTPESHTPAFQAAEWLKVMTTKSCASAAESSDEALHLSGERGMLMDNNDNIDDSMHFEDFEYSHDSAESITPQMATSVDICDTSLATAAGEPTGTHQATPSIHSSVFERPVISLPTEAKDADKSATPAVTLSKNVFPRSPDLEQFPLPSKCSPLLAPRHSRRKTLSIPVSQHFLEMEEQQSLRRSPAIAGSHLATRFGLDTPFKRISLHVGGGSLDFPLPASSPVTISNTMTQSDVTGHLQKPHIRRQQNMPNLLLHVSAPMSPPPSTPLPALPNPNATNGLLKPQHHTRGRSLSPTVESHIAISAHHVRATTIDIADSHRSPLRSHSPTKHGIKHATRFSSKPSQEKVLTTNSVKGRKHHPSSASAIAAVAAQLQKLTSPLPSPTLELGPASAPVSAPRTVLTIDNLISAHKANDLRLSMASMEVYVDGAFPFPVVRKSIVR